MIGGRDANTPRPSRQKAMSINAVIVRSEPHPNQCTQALEISLIVVLAAGFGCGAAYANAAAAERWRVDDHFLCYN